jgi:hypothetical protein
MHGQNLWPRRWLWCDVQGWVGLLRSTVLEQDLRQAKRVRRDVQGWLRVLRAQLQGRDLWRHRRVWWNV